jgi:capsular exopolysaccharide synthesis family protein
MGPESSATTASGHWATRLGIKAYRYRSLLKRRWWILAFAISLGVGYEAWILKQQPVQYESTGSLIVGAGIDVGSGGARYTEQLDGFYGTQIKILQNDEIQDRARQRLALTAPQLEGTVQLVPSVVPRSTIVSLVAHGSNAEYTQRFVDAVMDEYISYRREQKATAAGSSIQQITEELAKTRKQLDQNQKDLQDFIEKNNMAFWKESQKTSVEMLDGLKKQEALKMTELQQLQNLTSDQLLNNPGAMQDAALKPGPDSTQPSVTAQESMAPQASDLGAQYLQTSQELAQKQAELDEKSRIWKPKHPGIKKIRDEIDRLKLLIKTIKGQNRESTQARIEAIKAELNSLDASIKIWNDKVMESSRKDGQYQALQSAVTTTQSLCEKLVESIHGVDVGTKGDTDIVTIMQHATPPIKEPPGVVRHLLVGFILGLLAGGLILFLIDRADDRITSSTELIEYFSEPILGQIPNVEESRLESGLLPLLRPDDERYTFAESFRSLRSSLIFMPNQGELKTLIVTSSIPGEGKSTIASGLGITMALAGARVLLVDADLRRGDLASLFDVDGRVGLSSVLRGEVDWKSALQKTLHASLSLLPRGPVTNQSGELLLVPAFEPLLRQFKEGYDLVIFNSSPILATDDTSTIAPNFDGTLMVIRAQFTGARLTHNSMNLLYQRQVNVLGLILNCVNTEMPDYYYYRYPKYYAV